MILHTCPNCKRPLQSSEHLVGLTIVCPDCKERVPVPSEAASREAVTAAPPEAAAPPQSPEVDRQTRELLDDMLRLANRVTQTPPLPSAASPYAPRRLPVWPIAAGLAVLFGVVCFVAWLIAGTGTWNVILWILAAITFLPALFVGWEWIKQGFPAREGKIMLSLLYPLALFGAWFFIGERFALGLVHVDNYSTRGVRLDLDGSEWLTCRPHSTQEQRLRRGKHVITVRAAEDGKDLEQVPVEVDGRGTYVLNVLRAQTYARGRAQYGGLAFLGAPPEVAVKDAWFKADVDYLFQEPPQSITVSVRKGEVDTVGTSKTYLVRRPPMPIGRGQFP